MMIILKNFGIHINEREEEKKFLLLAKKYDLHFEKYDLSPMYYTMNKVIIQKFLKLLFDHFDFDGHEQNIIEFFNDVPKYPGPKGLMVQYKDKWPKYIIYRRSSLDNYLSELQIYESDFLKVNARFDTKNSMYKLIPYLRSEGLLIEWRDFMYDTYCTESTNESLKVLSILIKNNTWNDNDLETIQTIMDEYAENNYS